MDFLAHKCVCVNNHISTEERSRMNTGRKTSIKSIQIQFFFLHISKTTWFQVLGNPSQQAQMHTHLEYSTRSKHTNKQTPHFFFPICLRFIRPQGPQTQLSLFGGTHPSVSLLTVKATSRRTRCRRGELTEILKIKRHWLPACCTSDFFILFIKVSSGGCISSSANSQEVYQVSDFGLTVATSLH